MLSSTFTKFFLDPRQRSKGSPLKDGALSNIPAQSIPHEPIKFKFEFRSQTKCFFAFTAVRKVGSISHLIKKDIPTFLTAKERALPFSLLTSASQSSSKWLQHPVYTSTRTAVWSLVYSIPTTLGASLSAIVSQRQAQQSRQREGWQTNTGVPTQLWGRPKIPRWST